MICSEVVECVQSPCAINTCQRRLGSYNEAELQQALKCLESYSGRERCGAIVANTCGQVVDSAQRCCWADGAGNCSDPSCNQVPVEEPYPIQCLGIQPSEMVCTWVGSCCSSLPDCTLIGGSAAEIAEGVSACRMSAEPFNEPDKAADAAECRRCLSRGLDCAQSAEQCAEPCNLQLLVDGGAQDGGGPDGGGPDAGAADAGSGV